MHIQCLEYRPTAKGGATVKLQLEIAHGPIIEVSGWTVYNGAGKPYLNPPIAHRGSQIHNVVTFTRRSDRECFRVAAVAAINKFLTERQEANNG
jgi:hypothetical protein